MTGLTRTGRSYQARRTLPATSHLAQVIERARRYNADPARLLTIAEIAIFGSYLDPAVDRLGDLDLAVSAVRRETSGDRHVDKVLAYARASGRRFDAFHEQLFWPARELRMILKNRSPAISITSEDISKLTDRFEIVYEASDDPDAIPPPPDAPISPPSMPTGTSSANGTPLRSAMPDTV
jgi:predicted nucleotidyltransferase